MSGAYHEPPAMPLERWSQAPRRLPLLFLTWEAWMGALSADGKALFYSRGSSVTPPWSA